VDYFTFTSSSTVRNVVAQLSEASLEHILHQTSIAAIGPITARTARDHGLQVAVVATEYTIPGLVAAIVRHAQSSPSPRIRASGRVSDRAKRFLFAPPTEQEAQEIAAWQYEGPYTLYNSPGDELEESAAYLLDPVNQVYAVHAPSGELIGYCSFGADAQVPGFDYDQSALDVGAGMRPDLTGQGRGGEFMGAILDFGRQRFNPPAFRATIASWNERALRMAGRSGFERIVTFPREDGLEFTVLVKREM
jgi:RimJ/RimL family protein N-acetyltransferase